MEFGRKQSVSQDVWGETDSQQRSRGPRETPENTVSEAKSFEMLCFQPLIHTHKSVERPENC